MYGYFLIFTFFLWKRDKNLLERSINVASWVMGIVYGKICSSKLYDKFIKYLNNTLIDITIYGFKDHELVLLNPYNWMNGNFEKYYVKVFYETGNLDKYKILVFDNKVQLKNQYNHLTQVVKENKEIFNRFMEVCIHQESLHTSDKKIDILSVFTKYTSKDSFFSNVTNYTLKTKDLFDLNTKKPLLYNYNDKLRITYMNLQEIDFEYHEILH